ncbi:hypothetical protein [Brevibacillus centrosporus]|jgi:hypothetical protein|uniref:hypothetical protein n=1 Tax=Brevibacillus centrosporus TaxID=54910 RepID=UPI0037F95F51
MPTPEGKVIISKAQENPVKGRAEATAYSSIVSGELRIATIPGPMHLLPDPCAHPESGGKLWAIRYPVYFE